MRLCNNPKGHYVTLLLMGCIYIGAYMYSDAVAVLTNLKTQGCFDRNLFKRQGYLGHKTYRSQD